MHHHPGADLRKHRVAPDAPGRSVRPLLVAVRGIVVATEAAASLLLSLVSELVISVVRGREAGRAHRYGRIRRLLERLGPTYVKFGQIMSTRRDVLPAGLCDELAGLHDNVAPMSRRQARRAFAAAYGPDYDALFAHVDPGPVASGSIAGVYRASLRDGRQVALKLRRPGISSLMVKDLALLEGAARVAERSPKCQGMPIGDLAAFLCVAVLGQLDFEREAASLTRLRHCLAPLAGVRVPAVIPEASRRGCLAMELVEDLDVANVASHSPDVRSRLARITLEAAGRLLFVDGFVHCDLHPGNVYVTPDGQVVILDAGFSAEIPDEVRQLIGEFFMRLALGDGRRCAQIMLDSAARRDPALDVDGFTDAVATLVDRQAGPGAASFTMMSFGNELFDLQRDFGVYAKSDFAFPLMSLGVVESTVRMISPQVDFREVGGIGRPPPPVTEPVPRRPAVSCSPDARPAAC
jgi:ubiquinone biosynthesis protein